MKKGTVIAVDERRSLFAVQSETGACAVFCQCSGPTVQTGDTLNGNILARGVQSLKHTAGTCRAVGDTGPLSMAQALRYVNSSSWTALQPALGATVRA